MTSHFNAPFFATNRQRLIQQSGAKLVVIPSNKSLQRNGDSAYEFRQDSSFWYLTGVEEPSCLLVMTPSEEFLVTPKKDWVEDVFDGPISPKELAKTSGIIQIVTEKEGWRKIRSLIQQDRTVHILKPMQGRYFDISPNPARRDLITKLRSSQKGLTLKDLRLTLAQMRMIKQPQEIRALQRAIDITVDTVTKVFEPKWWQNYDHEYQIEAEITAGFRKGGAKGHAFTPIVAGGQNTCTIHHISNNSPLGQGETLLIDIGAEVSNYAADISRTIPIGEKFSSRQQEVFEATRDVHRYAIDLLKPGQNYIEYEKLVEQRMGQELKKLGLITKANRKSIRRYFPHRTSHMLGLDAHDAADYSWPLQKDMVLTVEPGIYIPKEGIGVRIEDDVLITKNSSLVMSKNLPVSFP